MFFRSNLPGILWALFILFLCGIPGDQVPEPGFLDLFLFDKLVHASLFLVLAFLLSVGFKRQPSYPLLQAHSKKAVFLISTLYGILLELLQYLFFFDRSFEQGDILANTAGALLGVIAFRSIYGRELA